MNIIYVSALEGGKYSGPLYSVPKQIESQKKFDNVFWVNLTKIEIYKELQGDLYHFIPLKSFSFEKLPPPFNNPDIVIFEEFFKLECGILARRLIRKKIPYIIVPRCQMTEKYIQNKKIKKTVASFLFFNYFAKSAAAVQFLTEQEKTDSNKYYKGKSFIVPNGIDIPLLKAKGNRNEIKICTFIGRYSIWQKGLDLLILSIQKAQDVLRENKIQFQLFGPNERTGSKFEVEKLIEKYNVSDLVTVKGPVFDNEKKLILLSSDMFIHTSRFEGLPMSVLEALAYGIPCLVTQGSNLREQIVKTNAGWGCDNDVEAIVEMLKTAAIQSHCLEEKANNAYELAKMYSWMSIARKTHEIYEQLLDNAGQEV